MRHLGFAALVLVALEGPVVAFPYGTQFDADPVQGVGGGGRVFVGAARDTGHTCAVCHVDTPGHISARLEADSVDLFKGYQPGARYLLKVVLADEWAGQRWAANGNDCGDLDVIPWRPCNANGFGLQIDDGAGLPVGTLGSDGCGAPSAADADVRVSADGTAITHDGERLHDRVSWSFCWTAPADDRGELSLHLALVDGSGGDGTVDNSNDPFNDDVFSASLRLPHQGTPATGQGCAITPDDRERGVSGILIDLLVIASLLWSRRRTVLVILLATFLAGCATTRDRAWGGVQPWQKEKLAKPIMLLHSDADEVRLDLHMLEAREGSAGGFGTSGGGCGCN